MFANKPCESSLLLLIEIDKPLAEAKPSRTGKTIRLNRENVRFVNIDAAMLYSVQWLCMSLWNVTRP